MYMGRSKPMGMDKEEFQEAQTKKSEEDFKYDTSQRIQNLQFAIDKINKSLAECIASRRADKQDCDIQISHVMESTMTSLKDFRQELGDFKDEIYRQSGRISTLNEAQNDFIDREEFKEQSFVLSEEIKKFRAEKELMKNDFKLLIQRLTSDFDTKLKSMKEEILSRPSEIPALKGLLEQKLEIVELNGQNAMLRSSNNERQLSLIERKIENIYQLIKKIDLTKE